MKQRPFAQIDVFTHTSYEGNPVAVVLDASDLDDDAMQQFARWTQLSETTFVSPPSEGARAAGADYRVRIFTPGGELPFAGHPTLGTAHAWREAGGETQHPDHVVQECGVGLVQIRRTTPSGAWAFAAPALQRTAVEPQALETVCAALGLDPTQILRSQHLNNGPHWLGLLIDSTDTLYTLLPDHSALKKTGFKVGVAAMNETSHTPTLIGRANREARAFVQRHTQPSPSQDAVLEVRAFAAPIGIAEDPVTGSLNASLGQWLIAEGVLPHRYTASQGAALGRTGRIYIEQDAAGQVWVGGHAVTCVNGQVLL